MQYVDLTLNPERFTGYSGPSAARIWRAIYEENCFNLDARALAQPSPAAPQTPGADADAAGTARALVFLSSFLPFLLSHFLFSISWGLGFGIKLKLLITGYESN